MSLATFEFLSLVPSGLLSWVVVQSCPVSKGAGPFVCEASRVPVCSSARVYTCKRLKLSVF
jgi:hypothetical protein